ncbi:MAG: hypothetical protein M3312_04420 [Actinomycetota bacterium]|nr:hypothetical protein [Actinomycetota bacterium]
MDFDVRPEPSELEREAIAQVVAGLLAPPAERRSEWWRTAIAENVLGSEGGGRE